MHAQSVASFFRSLILPAFLFWVILDCEAQPIQVLSNQDQRMEVFVGSAHIYQQVGNSWSDWHWLTTTEFGGGWNNAAGRKPDGSLYNFIMYIGEVFYCFQTSPNGGWGWVFVNNLQDLLSSNSDEGSFATAANPDGTVNLFILGSDKSVWWYSNVTTNDARGVLKNFGGHDLRFISLATNLDGRQELFAIGNDKVVYHKWQTATGSNTWTEWQTLGGHDIRTITTALNADGRLELFALGGDGGIYSVSQAAAGASFGAWRTIGGNKIKQFCVNSNQDKRLEIFAIGNDQIGYHIWQVVPNGSFGNWDYLGGTQLQAINACKDKDGRLNVFALGNNKSVYYKSQVIAGGGIPLTWANLGAASTNSPSSLISKPQAPVLPDLKINFTTNPSSGYIPIGSTANVIWSVQNCGSGCVINLKGWGGLGYSQQILNKNVAATGQITVQPTETDTKFTLTATGSNGNKNQSVTIVWQPNSGPAQPACTYYFFIMSGNSSVTPCFTTAVCAKDEPTAQAKAENENQGYTAKNVSAQDYINGCH